MPGTSRNVPGIPIKLLLKQMAEPVDGEERHKFRSIQVREKTVEDTDDLDGDYFKAVERDFAGMAGEILQRLNLSHMRKK